MAQRSKDGELVPRLAGSGQIPYIFFDKVTTRDTGYTMSIWQWPRCNNMGSGGSIHWKQFIPLTGGFVLAPAESNSIRLQHKGPSDPKVILPDKLTNKLTNRRTNGRTTGLRELDLGGIVGTFFAPWLFRNNSMNISDWHENAINVVRIIYFVYIKAKG